MPSKQAQQDVLAVEELVHEIKENLRLKAPPVVVSQSGGGQSAVVVSSGGNGLIGSVNSSGTGIGSGGGGIIQHQPPRSLRRPSPYHIPCRSWSDTCSTTPGSGVEPPTSQTTGHYAAQFSSHLHHHHHLSHHHHHHPHLQQPRKGSSTKKSGEDIDDPYELLQVLIKNNNLVKEAVRRLQLNLSPKQRYFYESDEESSRSPLLRMCQLEL